MKTSNALAQILAVGSQQGLGLAERELVARELDADPAAGHTWRRTVGFVKSEELLSAEATASFARALAIMPDSLDPRFRTAPTGTGPTPFGLTQTQLARIREAARTKLKELAAEDPQREIQARIEHADRLIEEGRARIVGRHVGN